MNTFKKNLQLIMEQNNLSQNQLSLITNIPASSISSWLGSRESLPNIEAVVKLADCFQCSIDYLLGRESEEGIVLFKSDNALSKEENTLITCFRKLDKRQQSSILGLIVGLAS